MSVLDKYLVQNAEVLYTREGITTLDRNGIEQFKQLSSANPRKRVRLCAHSDPQQRLHEMLIIHERGAYVRPHRHPGKSESTHIIEGLVDMVIFDDQGNVDKLIPMGDYASGRTFYNRMAIPLFHTLIIRSEVLVFHETTDGPFNRADTVFPPWAPEDKDVKNIGAYVSDLERRIKPFNSIS